MWLCILVMDIPKWHKRARLGIYLGRSEAHAQSVALVLNLSTGLVSPQYHVAFDEQFETIKDHTDYPNLWQSATHFLQTRGAKPPKAPSRVQIRGELVSPSVTASREPTMQDTENGGGGASTQGDLPPEVEGSTEPTPEPANVDDRPPGRWPARHRPTQQLLHSSIAFESLFEKDYDGEDEYEIQRQMADPIAFAASAGPDTMYYHQALKEPDRANFIEVMQTEVNTHTEKKHWELVMRRENVPDGHDILPTVWVMKRKRRGDTRRFHCRSFEEDADVLKYEEILKVN